MESRHKQQHIHASIRKRKVIPACFQANQDKNRFSTSKTMYANSANMLRAIDDITMCNSIRKSEPALSGEPPLISNRNTVKRAH